MTARGATYVVYRGDEVIAVGPASECASALGVRASTMRWLSTPEAHRRESAHPGRMVAERVAAAPGEGL